MNFRLPPAYPRDDNGKGFGEMASYVLHLALMPGILKEG